MSLKRLFLMDINETKQMIRDRIETQAEQAFEDERLNGFSIGAIEFGDDVSELVPEQKEELRIRSNKDLKIIQNEIVLLWGDLIERTANFQVGTDIAIKVSFIASVLCVVLKFYESALVLVSASLALYLISKTKRLFPQIMYILCGSFVISDKLLVLYHKYGRLEAAILFADYRNLSHITEHRKIWVYTTSHKSSPG